MKKSLPKEQLHTNAELKQYFLSLRKEYRDTVKKILNPNAFARFERRVVRLESKVSRFNSQRSIVTS